MEFPSLEAMCPAKRELLLWLALCCLCHSFLGGPQLLGLGGAVGPWKAGVGRERSEDKAGAI